MSIIENYEKLIKLNKNKKEGKDKAVGDIFFEEGAKLNQERVFPEDFDFELEEVVYNDAMKGDFSKVVSKDYAFELVNAEMLYPDQIISKKFGGKNEAENNVLLTKEGYMAKKKMEDELVKELKNGKNISVTFELESVKSSIVPLNVRYIFKGDENKEILIENWKVKAE